ncbi:MAG: DNA repair protein RecN [Candidatus Methylopumilus sp.]|jgi:DNA repair protein RecN (Recombination protein N)|nr:DNA repair protein RecN [Candidatus Methylopumilus sp.]NBW61367.1 DNA repair protein RecN [Methylophilaceae bacterium]
MLQSLSIRDFVIVDQLDLDFSSGLTVLTGETGAGKSILIDALSLALGARAESGMIRQGCEKTEISVCFRVQAHDGILRWLEDNAIELDQGELIFRRVLYQDGRSRAFLNGQSVTLQQLKEIGEELVDIYSQNAHHSLLKLATQRDILDDYAGASELAKSTAQLYQAWHQLREQREKMEQSAEQYQHELALLRDQCRELKQLNFTVAEWESLQQEHYRLSNAAELMSGCELILDTLSESDVAAMRQLNLARQQLQKMREIDPAFNEAYDTLQSGVIQVEESGRLVKRYLQQADLDPEKLAEVDARLQAVHATARKYRVRPEGLPELLADSEQRMQELSAYADDGELKKREQAAEQAYLAAAQQLSDLRQQAAPKLSQQITTHMQAMALAGGQFQVALNTQTPAASGLEQVEFLVAGHAGAEPRALNKVASGGELSRISLAIRVATAAQTQVQTMIFDEVDVGIGGGVAEIVGKLLRQLSASRQALVITHLPQVAAQGQHHLKVSKHSAQGATLSQIQALSEAERVEELARMLGGVEITDTTRRHAQEMLRGR